jgi:hypothetical protein
MITNSTTINQLSTKFVEYYCGKWKENSTRICELMNDLKAGAPLIYHTHTPQEDGVLLTYFANSGSTLLVAKDKKQAMLQFEEFVGKPNVFPSAYLEKCGFIPIDCKNHWQPCAMLILRKKELQHPARFARMEVAVVPAVLLQPLSTLVTRAPESELVLIDSTGIAAKTVDLMVLSFAKQRVVVLK